MSPRRRGLWAPVLLVATALAACSGAGTNNAGGTATAPSLPTPMATSTQTADATWATLPMGRLNEPANTFWQLLLRPAGAGGWSNQVEATATATNGGLVLASPGGGSLIVGIRPSALLSFTPLIATSDAARSWSDGLIGDGLEARPDALAARGRGSALALVNTRRGAAVMANAGSLATWGALVTEPDLARSDAGRACGLGHITAVGYLAGRPIIGGSCARPGTIGLFARAGRGWGLAGPPVPATFRGDRVEVLALGRHGATTWALLALVGRDATDLMAAWSGRHGRWQTSAPMALRPGVRVASFGPARGEGLFVLLNAASGDNRLMVATGPGVAWRTLPAPPPATATVAFEPPGQTDALAVQGATLTVWSLHPSPGNWAKGQVIHVPIQYGSSS